MSETNKFLPNILEVLSAAPENQDNLANIVHSVAEDVRASNSTASQDEVAKEVKQSLQVAADLGLIVADGDNIYRLQFNPSATKLPFAIQHLSDADQPGPSKTKKTSNRERDNVESGDDSDSAFSLNDDGSASDDSNQEEERRQEMHKNDCPLSLCYDCVQMGRSRARSSARRMKRTRSRSRRLSARRSRKSSSRGGKRRRRRTRY